MACAKVDQFNISLAGNNNVIQLHIAVWITCFMHAWQDLKNLVGEILCHIFTDEADLRFVIHNKISKLDAFDKLHR